MEPVLGDFTEIINDTSDYLLVQLSRNLELEKSRRNSVKVRRKDIMKPAHKGARRKAHRGLAHRKEAHGILPIRLYAHEDTCTLG